MKKIMRLLNRKEGWDVFNADGILQIQKVDGFRMFEDDDEAKSFVIARALGDKCPRAIAALKEINSDQLLGNIKEWDSLLILAQEEFNMDLNEWLIY